MSKKKIPHLLQLAQEMIEEEKISETLEFLHSLEPIDNYTERQKVIFYTLISQIHRIFGDFSKAFETGEKSVQFARNIEQGIEVVDAFLNMARVVHFMGKNRECRNLLEESFEILTNLPQISEKDRNRRLGLYYFYEGNNALKLGKPMKDVMKNDKLSIDLLKKWGSQASLARVFGLHALRLKPSNQHNCPH